MSTSATNLNSNKKQVSTLQARLALKGFECLAFISGGYFVYRWNLSRFCQTLDEVEAYLAEVGK